MNLLGGLQKDAADRLAAHPFFTNAAASAPRPITALYEQLFDIQNQIALKVGQIGIVTMVATVSGKAANPNRRLPYFDEILIVARTYENVLINRGPTGTGQSASVVAEACAMILHGWKPTGLQSALFLQAITFKQDPKFFIFDTVLSLQAGMTDTTPVRISLPTI